MPVVNLWFAQDANVLAGHFMIVGSVSEAIKGLIHTHRLKCSTHDSIETDKKSKIVDSLPQKV